MPSPAIDVERVGKRYLLGEGVHQYLSLRETMSAWLRRRQAGSRAMLWALRDVDLTVAEGEVVGIVGRNGAGKSTLFRILARITEPTTGVSRTRGRVGALLDVGTGFHPELTGRENIELNGAILGMTRADVKRRYDEIVEFAGVERFLDTPVKRYSSGMYLRLAFAVAAHLEPDIVVVDEVLAVGDVTFQQKCLGKMSEFSTEGRTVIFVSHELNAISRLCRRAVWLDSGVIQAEGPTREILDAYLGSHVSEGTQVELELSEAVPIERVSVQVSDESGNPVLSARRDHPISVDLRFTTRARIPDLDFSIYLLNRQGLRILHETWGDFRRPEERTDEPGEYEASMSIPPILPPGDYIVGIWMGVLSGGDVQTFVDREALGVALVPAPDDRRDAIERNRVLQVPVEWRVSRACPTPRMPP